MSFIPINYFRFLLWEFLRKDADEVDEENKLDSTVNDSNFLSIYHKDAYLTFRAICKISMKGLHDESGSQYDPIALQNK